MPISKCQLQSGHCCLEEVSQSSRISVLFISAIKSFDSSLNLLIFCVWFKSWRKDSLYGWLLNCSINFLTLSLRWMRVRAKMCRACCVHREEGERGIPRIVTRIVIGCDVMAESTTSGGFSSMSCGAVWDAPSRRPALADGQRSNSVSPSTSLGHSQMSASQSRTRISDRIGVHLDAETAIILIDSSRHSRTLTDELVGKEEASPDCRVHRLIQQERQNRRVPMTVNKWCPVDIKEGEGSWTPPAAVQQPRSGACPFATTRLPTIRSRTSSAVWPCNASCCASPLPYGDELMLAPCGFPLLVELYFFPHLSSTQFPPLRSPPFDLLCLAWPFLRLRPLQHLCVLHDLSESAFLFIFLHCSVSAHQNSSQWPSKIHSFTTGGYVRLKPILLRPISTQASVVVVCCGCVLCGCVVLCVRRAFLRRTPPQPVPPPLDPLRRIPLCRTPLHLPSAGPPKMSRFFPSPASMFALFFSLWVSSRVFFSLSGGLLLEFWWCFWRPGPSNIPTPHTRTHTHTQHNTTHPHNTPTQRTTHAHT